LKLLSTVIKKK